MKTTKLLKTPYNYLCKCGQSTSFILIGEIDRIQFIATVSITCCVNFTYKLVLSEMQLE